MTEEPQETSPGHEPTESQADPSPTNEVEDLQNMEPEDGLANFRVQMNRGETGEFEKTAQPTKPDPTQELDRILGIPLTIHVELGRKRLQISELLEVGAGSIVELDSLANSALNIYANQTLIAQGEAVVVGERYGIRVTEIVSPAERVKRLGGGHHA